MTSWSPPHFLNADEGLRKIARRNAIVFFEYDASNDTKSLDLSRLGVIQTYGLFVVAWDGSGAATYHDNDLSDEGIAKLVTFLSR